MQTKHTTTTKYVEKREERDAETTQTTIGLTADLHRRTLQAISVLVEN